MLGRVTTPQNLDERFRDAVSALHRSRRPPRARPMPSATAPRSPASAPCELFDAQLASRHLDLAARWLRSFNEGFYTIGSSGHEGNAAVAAALLPDRPGAAALPLGRLLLRPAPRASPTPPGTCCAAWSPRPSEPIAGGRHKVFGSADLNIIPTTSTVASHLPRAVGLAFSLARPRAAQRRVAGRRHRGRLLRRRLGQPRQRHRRAQRRRLVRPLRRTPAAAAGLRGQRPGHQRAVAGRVGRRDAQVAARAAVHRRRRLRPGRHLRRGRRGGRLRAARAAPARGAAPVHGPADGPRRRGRRGRLPLRRGDQPRPGARPAGRHRPAAGRGRPAHARRGDHPVRRDRLAGPQGRRGGARRAQAGLGRRDRRPARPAPPAARRPTRSPTRPPGPPAPAPRPAARRSAASCPSRAGR